MRPSAVPSENRRLESDISSDDASIDRISTAGSTSSSTHVTPRSRNSAAVDDGGGDPKGPLGLTLLHSPSKPQIDFIFVHGLGGGSRKTWSKTALLSHYWPQEWLPKDPAFKNVRIHTYGYDSDYLKGKDDCLNIHHIGKAFLGEISTSPHLAGSRTHIVAIGHSMGGLVIKKAYILAKQEAVHNILASRIAAIYFLATPHRGADSAKTLKSLLRVVYDRAYVRDLERNSGAIQVINDEFRHVSKPLELWSFYETQTMNLFGSTIVDPESAVLGYSEEKQMPMNADHRSICKFETQFDANYIILRNALASTVTMIIETIPGLELKENRNQIRDVRKYLGISEAPDDDLLTVNATRLAGSCHWLATMENYVAWRDGRSKDNKILWINGKPAVGKSVLAGYVIETLQESGQPCSYFFFKHGHQSKSSLSVCLRSLAFQMASTNAEARNTILGLEADDVRLEHADARTLWRMLFLHGIFQSHMSPSYWIIDALDECSNPSVLFDFIFSKMDDSVPLRILVTSRNTGYLDQCFARLQPNKIDSLSVTVADTLPDIKRVVENRIETLTIVGEKDQILLTETILSKSRGSFLWTILVLEEIMRCYSKKEIDQVLEDIPKGMAALYQRTLHQMSQVTRGKELAKAILLWTLYSTRPMTIAELSCALKLDLDDTFPKLKESITALCGQLVNVDKLGRVQMVHETAREFLLDASLESEFAVDKLRAHTRIARICFDYLTGEEMKPPRAKRRTTATRRADFADYACTAYSYHLARADPLNTDLFHSLIQFLKLNILTWIEIIATSHNLHQLIYTSKHLKTYADVCSVERSPLDPRMQVLQQWTVDLARIAAKFATALSASPSAIYWLIPPFCPSSSMISRTNNQGRRLTVLGGISEQWDDRLLCLSPQEGQPSALCYGDEHLAIGFMAGTVMLYSATSYQEHKTLDHGEAVKLIRFGSYSDRVATCGMKTIKVWDTKSGDELFKFGTSQRPLDMVLGKTKLMIASHKNYISNWLLGKDAILDSEMPWSDSPEPNITPLRRVPCALTISLAHQLLAVAYSGRPITLWDLEENAYFGSCGKKLSNGETSTHVVVALAFNPNSSVGLLAAAYLDGDLALIDPFSDEQLECFRANCQTLSPSPNGRLLAAGAADGVIHIYEFHTLKLLYRVTSAKSYIRQLSFSRDSLRFADIRGSQCTVWEPATGLRDTLSDDSSGTTSASIVDVVASDAQVKITAMKMHPGEEVVFCGRDDGAILLYTRRTASCARMLYSHKSSIRLLQWCSERAALLSVDSSNRIFLRRVQKSPTGEWLVDSDMLFQYHLESDLAIVDVLIGGEVGKFIVSTRDSDYRFTLDGNEEIKREHKGKSGIRKWTPHPMSPLHAMCIHHNQIQIYCWENWSQVQTISLSVDNEMSHFKSLHAYSVDQDHQILLELSSQDGSTKTKGLVVLEATFVALNINDGVYKKGGVHSVTAAQDISEARRKSGTASLAISLPVLGNQPTILARYISHVIGVNTQRRLVFIDHSSWVCSCDLRAGELRAKNDRSPSYIEYFRHFFIPYDCFAGMRGIVCALAQEDVLFARGGELMVIRGYSKHIEKIIVEEK